MRYSAEEVFNKFIKEGLPEEYKHLPRETLKSICFTPFAFLRKVMQSNVLTEIRFKYLGVFLVSSRKAKTMLEKADIRRCKGLITDEEFFEIKNMVDNHFKSIKKEKNED